MRRILDSEALHRDDDEPHAPRERRRRSYAPRAIRSVDASALSDWFVPGWLRRRAISVDVETPREAYAVGEAVPFDVTMTNVAPFPVAIETVSPARWTWSVDGHVEASHVEQYDPPAEPGALAFGRGERKRFEKRWTGLFRVSETEWEPAEPGEYAVGAAINVSEPERSGLAAETTVRVVPE